jgi:hypothetical protein
VDGGVMEGYCGRVTENYYVLCPEHPGEHAWAC